MRVSELQLASRSPLRGANPGKAVRRAAQTKRESDAWSHRQHGKPAPLPTAKRRFSGAPRADVAEPSAARGLDQAAYLAVWDGGRAVSVDLPGMPPLHVAARGDCDGMSVDARRRLLGVLHTIHRSAPLPVMVSQTFPEEVVVTPAEAKACRRAWAKRVARKKKKWCALWRMEAHPEMSARLGRVCPHFHSLTWGAWYDLDWVSRTWTEVVWSVLKLDPCLMDAGGRLVKEKHQAAGTNCERIRKWEGVSYCAKTYIAKEEEYPLGKAGRVWGWDRGHLLPVARVRRVKLTNLQVVAIKRRVREWMTARRINSEYLIRTIFTDEPTAFASALLAQTSWEAENQYHASGRFHDEP